MDSAELCRLFGYVRADTSVSVHNLAREKIYRIGKQLGYDSRKEYSVPSLIIGGRTNRYDVVWLLGGKISVAFEIRAKIRDLHIVTTEKDNAKLRFLDPPERFIVNVSKITGRAYFHKLADAEIK